MPLTVGQLMDQLNALDKQYEGFDFRNFRIDLIMTTEHGQFENVLAELAVPVSIKMSCPSGVPQGRVKLIAEGFDE